MDVERIVVFRAILEMGWEELEALRDYALLLPANNRAAQVMRSLLDIDEPVRQDKHAKHVKRVKRVKRVKKTHQKWANSTLRVKIQEYLHEHGHTNYSKLWKALGYQAMMTHDFLDKMVTEGLIAEIDGRKVGLRKGVRYLTIGEWKKINGQ